MNLKIFAEIIDEATLEQIHSINEQEHYSKQKIRIMPDCHMGKGACVGYTQELSSDFVNPAFVGVDIGCGVTMLVFESSKEINLEYLDKQIKNNIPSGIKKNKTVFRYNKYVSEELDEKIKKIANKIENIEYENVKNSLCSLGGGNHFIELGYERENKKNIYYLTVHSGSRNFGLKVATFYIEKSREMMNEDDLTLVDGKEGYFDDIDTAQQFAKVNRDAMLEEIYDLLSKKYSLEKIETINSTHNYIDFSQENPILRKGAISAKESEILLIPFNMRDGIIIAKGKGNEDWNYSAPHGAGRLLSRKKANQELKSSNVREIMKGIYTSTAQNCIDELPKAYKPMKKIVNVIEPTVEIIKTIKPIYNFKAK